MIPALALSGTAWACVCGPGFSVVPVGASLSSIEVPPNAVFRLYEGVEGAAEDEGWGVFDRDGEPVPTSVERLEEFGGNTLLELRPTELLAQGTTYVLRSASAVDGLPYVVSGEVDRTPPPLTDARFEGRGHLRDTSCGDSEWIEVALDPPPDDPLLLVRILDLDSELYWHRPGLTWNDTCGGYPPESWSGAKDVSLVDWAGNESEPVRTRSCGCSATGTGPGWAIPVLLVSAMGSRRRRQAGVRGRSAAHADANRAARVGLPQLDDR